MPNLRHYLQDGELPSFYTGTDDEEPLADEWRLEQLRDEQRLDPTPANPYPPGSGRYPMDEVPDPNNATSQPGWGPPDDTISIKGWGPTDSQTSDTISIPGWGPDGHGLTGDSSRSSSGTSGSDPSGSSGPDFWSKVGVDPNYKGSQLNLHPNSTTPGLDRLSDIIGQRPILGKPKWWQQLAAGVAGGAAGWTNADGRHHPQIDIGAMTDNLLHPGYQEKLEQWKSRVTPAQTLAEIEARKIKMAQEEQKARSEAAYKRSQVEYNEAGADFRRGLGRMPAQVEVTPAMSEASGIAVGKMIPAATANRIMDTIAGKYAKKEDTIVVSDPDMAKILHVQQGARVPITTYNTGLTGQTRGDNTPATITLLGIRASGATTGSPKIDAMTPKQAGDAIELAKDRAPVDPFIAQDRRDKAEERTRKDLEGVGASKDAQERAILNNRRIDLNALLSRFHANSEEDLAGYTNGTPNFAGGYEAMKKLNRLYAPQLQAVHDEYVSRARSRDEQVPDMNVNPDSLAYTLRVPSRPAAPAAQPVKPKPAPQSAGPQPLPFDRKPAPVPPAAAATPSPQGAVGGPIHLTLPNGKRKTFPDEKSANAFAAAAGLTMAPHK